MSEFVSRETPSTPELARRAFSSQQLPLVERYVELLATAGVERGLIGPREAGRLWERHVLNCTPLARILPAPRAVGGTVADLGSGAGLPGVILAILRPDLAISLVEPLLRRTTFLTEVADELALTGVEVVRARADALHGARRFDVVTARAVAPLDRLLGWAMPLVEKGGALVAMKGASAQAEVDAAAGLLERLDCGHAEVLTLVGADGLSTATIVRVAQRGDARIR